MSRMFYNQTTSLINAKCFLSCPHCEATIRTGEFAGTEEYHQHRNEINLEDIYESSKDRFWKSKKITDTEFAGDTVTAPAIPDIEPRTRFGKKDPHHFVNGFSKVDGGNLVFGVFGDGLEHDEADSIFRASCLEGQSYAIDIHGASDEGNTFDSRLGTSVPHDISIGTADSGTYGTSKYNMATVERVAREYLKSKGFNGFVCVNGEKYRATQRAMAKFYQDNNIKAFQIEFSRRLRDVWEEIDIPRLLELMATEFIKTN